MTYPWWCRRCDHYFSAPMVVVDGRGTVGRCPKCRRAGNNIYVAETKQTEV